MTNINYTKRAQRIRSKLKKVNSERFRLTVFRSSRNISAQIIDDKNNRTLISASSLDKDLKASAKKNKSEISKNVAEKLALKATEKNIKKIYLDRGLYKYHGRVRIFAETLRQKGLKF